MEEIIIISNLGSASKKYSVYQGDLNIAWFHFEKVGDGFLCSSKVANLFEKKHITNEQYNDAIVEIFESIKKAGVLEEKSDVTGIAIRVVVPHEDFVSDLECTPDVLDNLHKLQDIDPLHITPVIKEVDMIREFFGSDTSIYFISDSEFHIPSRRRIPLKFNNPKFTIGYHGLSCESVLSTLKKEEIKHSKLIVVHLGGGSSVTAIKNGTSVYNSMEFSPLGGMVMSSRTGSIDPFAVLYYMKEQGLTYEQTLEHLYSEAGLLALSEISSDLRVIREEAFKGNKNAKNSIMQYVDSIAAHICKASSYTEGFDTLVFTGTIGFRAQYIREMVLEKLIWLGCVLDHNKNNSIEDTCVEISSYDSKVKIFALQVDEMKEMHSHTKKFLKSTI